MHNSTRKISTDEKVSVMACIKLLGKAIDTIIYSQNSHIPNTPFTDKDLHFKTTWYGECNENL